MKVDELVKEINAIKRIQVELVDDFKFVFYEESEVVPFFELLLDAKNLDDGRSRFKYADSVFMQDFAKMLSILNEYIETPLAQRTTPQKFYLWFNSYVGDGRRNYFEIGKLWQETPEFNDARWKDEIDIAEALEEYADSYKLTKEQIMLLPKDWHPIEFGGPGFTKLTRIKG